MNILKRFTIFISSWDLQLCNSYRCEIKNLWLSKNVIFFQRRNLVVCHRYRTIAVYSLTWAVSFISSMFAINDYLDIRKGWCNNSFDQYAGMCRKCKVRDTAISSLNSQIGRCKKQIRVFYLRIWCNRKWFSNRYICLESCLCWFFKCNSNLLTRIRCKVGSLNLCSRRLLVIFNSSLDAYRVRIEFNWLVFNWDVKAIFLKSIAVRYRFNHPVISWI